MPLTDPRHLALVVRLAATLDRAPSTNDLLLTIWPHLTPQHGTAALEAAVLAIAAAAGRPLVSRNGDRWTLDREVECDFDRASAGQAAAFGTGLTLPETPEWDQWVGEARAEIGHRPAAPSNPTRLLRTAAVAVGSVAVLLAVVVTRRVPVEGFRPGDQVILADVADRTADTVGRAIQVAAAVGLAQASRIELVSRNRVVTSLPSNAADSILDVRRALEAATALGVPWVVSIQVEPDGGATRVVTRLLRAGTEEVVFAADRSASHLLDLLSATAHTVGSLLTRLGEPDGAWRDQQSLGMVTSTNLDALKAYAEGSAAWSRGGYQLAGDYWRRAITLDTGFAMAMGSLGAYYYYSHDRAEGERFYQAALARRGRLTDWERLQLESRYAGWRGDRDSAIAVARLIAARFPRASTFFNLGTALLGASRCDEGLESLKQARRLEPRDVATHINIATCQSRLGRYDQSRLAYLEANRLDSMALYRGNVNLEYAGVALKAGHPEEAESVLVRMARRPSLGDRALGIRGLGFLAFWRGDVARAREAFRRAADVSRQQGASNSLLRNLALVAAMDRVAGRENDLRETLRQVDSLAALPTQAPGFLALAAEAHIVNGTVAPVRDLFEAARQRADPRNRGDSVLVHYLEGATSVLARAPQAGLVALARAEGYLYPQQLHLRRAQAHAQLGQLDSARTWLATVVADPRFGSEGQLAWIQALIEIGAIEERLGRNEEAIASYRRFLEHWNGADPNLPDVAMARSRLAALLATRDR